MIKRTLYFVRHGLREDFENPAWKETCQNPWDPPLSANGREQAADVGAFFADKSIHSIFSSPFLRTLETAEAVAAGCGAPIRLEEGLCEWLNPAWHDVPPMWLSVEAAAECFRAVDPSGRTIARARYPETEEKREVRERCRLFLDHILCQESFGNLVFVSHGSPMGQCVGHLLGSLDGIDFSMAAITGIAQEGGDFRLLQSGCGHLRVLDETGRFF